MTMNGDEIFEGKPLNSFDEWSPLKEVIIGDLFGFYHNIDITSRLFFYDNILANLGREGIHVEEQHIHEMREDVNNLVKVLEDKGIVVKRPNPLRTITPFKTPYWKGAVNAPISARDLVMVYGNKIIETPVCVRDRYFETDCYKAIFYDYFSRGAEWISAPKPMLLDNSIDTSYIKKEHEKFFKKEKSPMDVGYEISFDAAQCIKIGKEIIMNVSNDNHRLGAKWLQRVLPDAIVHTARLTDNHIDACLLPLRPGIFLCSPYRLKSFDDLPEKFRKWKIINMEYTESGIESHYHASKELDIASPFIDCNILSIGPNEVMVNSANTKLCDRLYKEGFDVTPVQLRWSRLFGAGIHCLSLDTIREGSEPLVY